MESGWTGSFPLWAAGSASYDALKSGANAGEAFALGTGAGAIELLTEQFSLEHLVKLSGGYGGKQIVMDVLKQAGVEASEEAAAEILNNILNTAVMGGSSDYRRYAAALMEQGMSPEDAEKEAFKQFYVRNVAESALGGALSGGVMGGGAMALDHVNARSAGRQLSGMGGDVTQAVIQEGLDSPADSRSYQMAQAAQDRLNGGKTVSDAQLGRLYWANVEQIDGERAREQQDREQAGRDAAQPAGQEDLSGQQESKYSLKAFEDGTRFVEVDTDQAQFDGLSERDLGRLATQVIKERFAGRVIGLDNRVFVNGRSASEYGFPVKHLTADQHEAKMRASTELDNLVDAGTNFRTEPDGRDGHIHPEATGSFRYFDTIFKVGGEYYRGTINIMQTAHGLLLKDVTQIENVTQAISSSYGQSPKSTILRDASMPTIAQSDMDVKAGGAAQGGAAALFEASKSLGKNGQKALAAAWDGERSALSGFEQAGGLRSPSLQSRLPHRPALSPSDFFGGFSVYYQAGLTGKDLGAVRSPYAGALSEAQRFAAYSAGQNDAKASLAKEKAAAPFAKTARDEAGLVYDEFVAEAVESGRQHEDKDHETRTYLTAETAGRINQMARDLGVRVRFAEQADPEGKANGSIDGSEIVLERDNPNPVMAVAGHELAHRMQDLAPKEFRAFRDLAVQDSPEGAVEKKLRSYAACGYTLTHEQAMDEVAADYAGRLMDKGALLSRFIEANRGKRTLLQRLRDLFRNLAARLRGQERQKAQGAADCITAALETAYDAAAANAARLNGDAQGGAEGVVEGDVRYSIKNTSKMTLSEQLKRFYDGKMASSDSFYFGDTPAALSKSGFDGLPLAMTTRDFRKSTREKHNIPRRVLKNLAYNLEHPLFSFGSGDRAAFVLNDIDGDGKPLLAALQSGVTMDRSQVNVINSLYGIDDPAVWLRNQIESGKEFVLYDEAGANAFLQTYGYLASVGDGIRSIDGSIAQGEGEVKGENGDAQSGAEGGETRYSLKQFKDGKRFVDVETDQARFDGLTYVEMEREARKVIKEKFKGKVIGIDHRVFVNGLTAKEYGHPQKRLPQLEHEAKMRASTELDNLMDAGTNFRTEPDGRDGHIHPEATGDFQYFDTIFKVGGEYYQGTINIMPIAKGLLLKDITQIKNITQDTRSSYGDNPQATFLRDVSMGSVSQQDGEVKGEAGPGTRYSIKNTSQQTLKEQLRNYYNGTMRSSDAFYFGETPSTLSAAGLDALPLTFSQKDFAKSTREKHNVPRRVLNNLNHDLETALFAFSDGDRVGILTGDIDGDGKPLLVGIQSGVQMDAQKVNVIHSAYGLDNPAQWLKNQIDAGKTLTVLDEERANAFLYPYGYLASRKEGIRSIDGSIAQGEGEVKGEAGPGTRYSLKQFEDGRRFVEVETDQDRFAGLTTAQMQVEAKKIIMERFRGKVIGDEYTAYVDRMSAEHYTHPANRRMDEQIKRDKMQASPELDNILAASTFRENVPDDGRHPSATGGLDKLDVIFRVNGRTYNAEITVLVTDRGRIFYDMTKFKDTTSREIDLASGEDAAKTADSVLNKDSVAQPDGDVNGRFSLKDSTITKSYDALLRENQALRERAEYWRGQTRRTTEISTDKKAVARAARELAEGYGATLDTEELAGRLQSLYDALTRGYDGKDEIGPRYAWEKAEAIARDLAESAVETASLAQEFPGLKQTLRDTRIAIGREYDGDIRNEDFRRRYFGKLKLTSQGTTNVDSVYQELAQDYPSLFPGDITHPADQLERILDVTDELYTVREQNPFSGDMEQAVLGITNEIVERFFELLQTRATFADRQAAKLEEAVAHGRRQARQAMEEQAHRLREQNRQTVQRAVQRERETRARQIKALKERYVQSRKDAAGRRADRKARDRLLNIAKRLQNKKLPEVNRTLLKKYIGELDTVAKSMTGATGETLVELKEWYDKQRYINPDFIADPYIEKKLERLYRRQIADLSAQEVAELTEALLNIENELRTQRKLIDSQERRDIYAAGEALIRDVEASAGSRPDGLRGLMSDGIVTETLSPLRMARRITGYAPDSPLTRAVQELADGQRAMLDYQMKAEAQFAKYTGDKSFTKGFAGPKARGIQIQGMGKNGPVTATITPAMRASLYLHSLNDQNLKHIRDGGIRVPNWELYHKGKTAEAYDRGTVIRLTPSQVRAITAQMTQKERAFAMAAHRYFNQTSREAINAVSEKLKGYSIAQVENYFPIHTDTAFTKGEFSSIKFDGTVEGMGFLKERVNAANPILLRELNAELKQSYELHSKYVGLAIPVRNFNKLWNVETGRWVDGDTLAGYNGAEGGGSYGAEGISGEVLRGEDRGADAGGTGADASIPGGIARWAQNALVEAPGGGAGAAVKILQSYGIQAVAVSDAALKARRASALALTEGGVVYISDALTEELAENVGNHEAIHAIKQRGSAAYEAFLENVGGEIDLHSQTADYVLKVITKARFGGKDLLELTPAQQRTVFDELNAVVWGFHKADAQNAREQFGDVFQDYESYVQVLGGILKDSGNAAREAARQEQADRIKARSGERFEHATSVKDAVKEKWGGAAVKYIDKMMGDLQGARKGPDFWGRAFKKLQSNYAVAVLTNNVSVAMKQAASYPTAAAVLGWGPLAKAMGSSKKETQEPSDDAEGPRAES